MAAIEKINSFVDEYNTKLQQMNEKLEEAIKRKEDIQLELRYVTLKEIPAAVEKRVLTGETALENKLKKLQLKLQDELQDKEETVLVLTNAIQRYKEEAAAKIAELDKSLFRQEKHMIEAEAYVKLGAADKEHRKHLVELAKPLHDYNKVQNQINNIIRDGGMRASHSDIEIPFHNVYLEITKSDLVSMIKGLKVQ